MQETGAPAFDAVEDALAGTLTEAPKAGRFDLVGQLAREAEAARLASTTNVTDLAAKRRRR